MIDFDPFSPILPVPIDSDIDEAAMLRRRHIEGHYVVGGFPAPDAPPEVWEGATDGE